MGILCGNTERSVRFGITGNGVLESSGTEEEKKPGKLLSFSFGAIQLRVDSWAIDQYEVTKSGSLTTNDVGAWV